MLFLAEASFMLLKTSNVPYNSIQIHYEIFMRRSIFHRHKPHKLADRLRPVSADPIGLTNENGKVHDGVTQLRKKLGGKNLKIGAIITLIAGVVAWVGQNRTPPLPITEQALTLPNSSTTKATTNEEATPSTAPAKAPAVALPPVNAVAVTKVAHNNIQPPLAQANSQAIQSAKNGDPQTAVSLLESALINDPESGVVFDNLRKLYAGFATQSYQLAIDPAKNQAVIVELSDAQQKYNVQIPVMNHNNTRTALAKIDATKAMPNLPQAPLTQPEAQAHPVKTTDVGAALTANTAASIPPIATTPITAATPEPVAKLPPPPAPTAAERKEINTAVMQTLKNWSDAWSKQDVVAYLASYSANYAPKGTTHKEWADYRAIRLKAPKFVKVELSDQKAVLTDNTHVRVGFTQSYASDTLKAKDKKTLELELIDNTWLITSESGR